MNTLSRTASPRKAADVISAVRISDVIYALTGKEPRRTGSDTFRTVATWRGGDGLSVAGDDSRGIWHDFVTDEGGGVLDLIVRIRGGSRQEALRWAADFAGVPLEEKEFTPAERSDWVRQQRELDHYLRAARHWRRAAISMTEDLLTVLKSRLVDPIPAPEDLSQPVQLPGAGIFEAEQALTRLQRLDGAALVQEYLGWLADYPGMTSAMVRAAKAREQVERRAVLAYLRACEKVYPGKQAA